MKSPAFQFYPTDYLGSQRVQMMTLEEEGAYCRLLWSCWQHGSIPSDPELAARLIGKGCSTTVARVVLPMFEVACGEGRVTHDRLEREREKQAQWREKSAAGGRKSAEMRKGGSTVVQPPCQPKADIPAPSPSPSPIPSPSLFPNPEEGKRRKDKPENSTECVEYAREIDLPDPSTDGNWFWDKGLTTGWKINGKAMKDWRAAMRTWNAKRYFPSQQPNFKKPAEVLPVKFL